MLTCKEASMLLSQAQERRLRWREQLGLRVHLVLCDGCAGFRKQLEFMRAAVQRYRDGDAAR